MPDLDDTMTVRLEADLSDFRADMGEATRLARGFGAALTGAFEGAIVKGRSLGDVLRDLALRLARIALSAALGPLEQGLSAAIGAAVQGALPFARGGVVSSPHLLALSGPGRGGLGIAGEAGPEAILPLRRGADGRLGVTADTRPVSVTFNITTPDIEGFRRARGQIAADLSRLVERGARNR